MKRASQTFLSAGMIILLFTALAGVGASPTVALAHAARAAASAKKVGSLSGKVTNLTTNKPISGATVSARHCAKKKCTTHTTRTGKKGKFSFKNLAVGGYSVSVSANGYGPSGVESVTVHNGKASHANFVLKKRKLASISLVLTADPSSPTVGQTTKISATLSKTVSDGTVTIHGTGPVVMDPITCQPIKASCGIEWNPPVAGAYTIEASWTGDATYKKASGKLDVTVNKGATSVSVKSSPAQPTENQTTTLQASVSVGVGDGTVSFSAIAPGGASATLNNCTPSAGTCSITWLPSVAGTWTITATWSGDSSYAASSDAIQVNVTAVQLPASISIFPGNPVAGQANALGAALNHSVSDGTLTFSGKGPGSASLSATSCTPTNGTCSISWQPSAPGTWTITVQWSGDAVYAAGSSSLDVLVANASTPISVSVSPSPPLQGHTTTITVNIGQDVSDGFVTLTGTGPNFQSFPSAYCIPTHGRCDVSWNPPASGSWTLNAYWTGDSSFPAGLGALTFLVNGNIIGLSLSANPNPVLLNHQITVTATLDHSVNDGTVTFVAPSSSPFSTQTCTPFNGVCSATWTPSTSGTWTISVTYSGDDAYSPVSGGITVTVSNAFMVLSVSPNPVTVGNQGSITAEFDAPVDPTSTVGWSFTAPDKTVTSTTCTVGTTSCGASPPSFVVSWSCDASYETCTLTWAPNQIGQWKIVANWSGDSAHHPTGANTTAQVNAFVAVSANPNPVPPGGATTLSATLGDNTINDGSIDFVEVGPGGVVNGPEECRPVNGSCSQNWQPSVSGTWTVTAHWNGDAAHPASSTSIQVTAQ